jgi:hypothetical protein
MTTKFTLRVLNKQAQLRDKKIYFKQKLNKLLKKLKLK